MEELPRASVIVAAFNAEATIVECIDSLLGLKYPRERLELIIVDNASTDRTAALLSRYNGEVRVLTEGKRGAAAARNRGLLCAEGEVVAHTDADCVVDEDWLRHMVVPLQEEDVGIVGGRILARRPCNKVEGFTEFIHDNGRAINEFKPGYVDTASWASRLSLIKQVGLFDEELLSGEDVDLSWRIVQRGYRLAYAPEAIVYHGNERSLVKLFRTGCVHRYHASRLHRKHRVFLQRYGYRRFSFYAYTAILASLVDFVLRRNPDHAICFFTFSVGKEVGRLFGAARWLFRDR